GRRLQGAHKLHKVWIFAQAGKFIVVQSALDGIAFLIGLAQVVTALLMIIVLSVHLRHYVVKMAQIIGGNQLDSNATGRRAIKNSRIDSHGELIFFGGMIKVFLREIGCAQVAMEAGIVIVQLDGLFILLNGGAKIPLVVVEGAQVVIGFGIFFIDLDGRLKFLASFSIAAKQKQA